MKNTAKRILILLIALSVSTKCAFCYTMTQNELSNIIKNNLKSEISQKYQTDDIKITIMGVPVDTTVTNESLKPKVEIIPLNNQINGFRKIIVKDNKNNTLRTFSVNVQALIYKDVLTALETIPFNASITNENTILEKREVSKYIGKIIEKPENDYISKRNIQKGSLILKDFISKKPAVSKDSTVDVLFISKGLTIKLQGKVLKEGGIGDTIPIKTNKYNKIYNAKVNSNSEVIVRI